MATIRKKGEYQWHVQVRKKGYAQQTRTFDTKAEAIAWANMIESEMSRGIWVNRGEAERTTLRETLNRYSREISAKKRGAVKERSIIAALLADAIADRPMATIRGQDIAALRDGWLHKYTPGTVLRRLILLSHVFTVARKEWGMESLSNPVELVRKPQVRDQRTRRVTPAELDAISRASQSEVLPPYLTLAVETGMRRGELCQMRWEHLDLTRKIARLPADICKNGDARDVPLSPRAIKTLRALGQRTSGLVLGVKPDTITLAFIRAVARALKKYVEKCETSGHSPDPEFLTDVRVHDLRHEATSRLATRFQMHELAKITGHKSTQMLLRYYHPDAGELAKRLGRAPRPRPSA